MAYELAVVPAQLPFITQSWVLVAAADNLHLSRFGAVGHADGAKQAAQNATLPNATRAADAAARAVNQGTTIELQIINRTMVQWYTLSPTCGHVPAASRPQTLAMVITTDALTHMVSSGFVMSVKT